MSPARCGFSAFSVKMTPTRMSRSTGAAEGLKPPAAQGSRDSGHHAFSRRAGQPTKRSGVSVAAVRMTDEALFYFSRLPPHPGQGDLQDVLNPKSYEALRYDEAGGPQVAARAAAHRAGAMVISCRQQREDKVSRYDF